MIASRLATATCLVLLSPSPAAAQVAHYWGDHFGNESVLLNGTVIGSVTDAGAVFYNPARLLHQEAPSFVASAKLYEWTTYRIRDGLGEGQDLEQSRFGGAPGFLVGTFTLPFLEGHQFAYGIMTRSRANVAYSLREEASGDLFPQLGGDDSFVGFAELSTSLKDDWAGVSWARSLGEHVGVGASLFYYERSFGRNASFDLRGIGEDLEAASLEMERSYTTKDKGLVGKLGLAWRGGAWSLGASATLPYWALSTSASLRYENFGVGLVDGGGTPIDNVLESTVQGKLGMEWKTPWAVGAGAGWSRGSWQLHAAAEYYSAVPAHVVLQSSDTVFGQSTGDPIEYTVVEERRAVLDGGVGVRWSTTDALAVFASVAANYSAAPDSVIPFTDFAPVVSHTSQQMDFVLVGGGFSVDTRWGDLTFGATWQASREPSRRVFDVPNDPGGSDENATVEVSEWRFLVGFSVPFFDERLGSLGGS